jgi:hypothetical protein
MYNKQSLTLAHLCSWMVTGSAKTSYYTFHQMKVDKTVKGRTLKIYRTGMVTKTWQVLYHSETRKITQKHCFATQSTK